MAKIQTARAEVSEAVINAYFNNLEKTLVGISDSCILNYDETNLTEDPGSKKAIVRRGHKHPD